MRIIPFGMGVAFSSVIPILLLPASAMAGGITLEGLIGEALASHPDLIESRASREAQFAVYLQSRGAYTPDLTAAVTLQRTDDHFGSPANSTTTTEDYPILSLSLTEDLYDFGARAAESRAEAGRLRAADAEIARTEADIVLAVRTAYYGALLAGDLLELRIRTVEARRLLRDHVEALVSAGVRPRFDLVRAEVDLENARADRISAETNLENSRWELARAVGRSEAVMGDLARPAEEEDIPSVEALIDEALTRRPEVVSAAAAVEAYEDDLREERRNRWPVLSLTGTYFRRDRDVDGVGNPILDEVVGSLAFSLSEIDFWEENADILRAEADLGKARSELADTRRGVRIEIHQRHNDLLEAMRRVDVARRLVGAATESLTLSRQRYDAGAGTITDIVDAQVIVTDAEESLLRAETSVRIARANLDRAAGIDYAGRR